MWLKILEKYRTHLSLDTIQLDGSHTPVRRGGEKIGYQAIKKTMTTNLLFLTDSKGLPVACSEAIAGNHHDVYEIEKHLYNMLCQLSKAKIRQDGLFLNAIIWINSCISPDG